MIYLFNVEGGKEIEKNLNTNGLIIEKTTIHNLLVCNILLIENEKHFNNTQ